MSFSAIACTVATWPREEDRFDHARSVFVGHVVHVREKPSDRLPGPLEEIEFRLIEVLKGQAPPEYRILASASNPAGCGIAHIVGLDYLFFLTEDQSIPIGLFGSELLGDATDADASEILRKLRERRPPPR